MCFMRAFHTQKNRNRGFVLMYSVLVSSLLLSIGLAIFNISSKELQLSGAAKGSQFAFYAADSGLECVQYWESKSNAFATSTKTDITCGGMVFKGMGGNGYDEPSTFTIDSAPNSKEPYCTIVSVVKKDLPRKTIIESRGYNTCNTQSPRRVERALRLKY